jgi:hypothetical protein
MKIWQCHYQTRRYVSRNSPYLLTSCISGRQLTAAEWFRWSDNCFPMRNFAEIWGNSSDHDTNNLSFGWRKICVWVFELEDFTQNWRMLDVSRFDSHEKIEYSWTIPGIIHSKYYFAQESAKFDRLKAPVAHPMRFHSAVFQNEWWLSGWFRGKSQATKEQSGLVRSPSQVYKIILIPHREHAETDSRLPQ